MPFFDNPKYVMASEDKEVLIRLLNSDEEIKTILGKIRVLQRRRIGKSNPRTQRLHELEEEKEVFVKSYNEKMSQSLYGSTDIILRQFYSFWLNLYIMVVTKPNRRS